MDRKRKNIPARVRWSVFQLDDPRKEFDIEWESINFRAWHMTPAEGFALVESEVQHGL